MDQESRPAHPYNQPEGCDGPGAARLRNASGCASTALSAGCFAPPAGMLFDAAEAVMAGIGPIRSPVRCVQGIEGAKTDQGLPHKPLTSAKCLC